MRASTAKDSTPRRRRGKASITTLSALFALVAGAQALAPASAGAMVDSSTGTECVVFQGLLGGWGGEPCLISISDGAGGSAANYGEVVEITDTDPICDAGDPSSCQGEPETGGTNSGSDLFGYPGGSRPPAKKSQKQRLPGTGLTPQQLWKIKVARCKQIAKLPVDLIRRGAYYWPGAHPRSDDPAEETVRHLNFNISEWIKKAILDYQILGCFAITHKALPE